MKVFSLTLKYKKTIQLNEEKHLVRNMCYNAWM